MITQPDLGKKILELRLAKGFTQGELAEKCNVSLRTIQRIESAEVMPRSYTIKLIFESLDYEIYSSFGKLSYKLDHMDYKLRNGKFSKVYTAISNLKNNKMNIISKLSILLFSIAILLFGMSEYVKAKNLTKNNSPLTEINPNLIENFNAGDFEAIGSIFLNDAIMNPTGYPEIHGRAAIIEYFEEVYDTGFRLTNNQSKQVIIADSIAIDRGSWKGINQGEFTGNYLTQWRRIDGNWYIENHMTHEDQ